MIRFSRKIDILPAILLVACLPTGRILAQTDANKPEPSETEHAVNERNLLLDEIGTIAEALSRARTGRPPTSSQPAEPAGFGTLPLPEATSPIRADGKLDEPAWQNATGLPVGPLFVDWRQGPFMLRVSACRDDAGFYLAIRSPYDLSRLRAAFGSAALFEIADQLYRVDEPAGNIKWGTVRKNATGQTIEMALPLPEGPIRLTFHTQLVRRLTGSVAREERAESDHVAGLRPAIRDRQDPYSKAARLGPVEVKLIPAAHSIKFKDATVDPNEVQISYTLRARDRQPKKRQIKLQETGNSGVYRYRYSVRIGQDRYEIESCLYVEPIAHTLGDVWEILSKSTDQDLSKEERDAITRAVEEIERELDDVKFHDRKQWRRLYREARLLKERATRDMAGAP